MCPRTPNMDALVKSPHSAYFHRFYAAAGVCSPTRAAALTGRTNERDCIHFALGCDQEDPAPGCAQGKQGALPHNEFTIAKAAKKSSMGDYQTIQLGKWCGAVHVLVVVAKVVVLVVALPVTAGRDGAALPACVVVVC